MNKRITILLDESAYNLVKKHAEKIDPTTKNISYAIRHIIAEWALHQIVKIPVVGKLDNQWQGVEHETKENKNNQTR